MPKGEQPTSYAGVVKTPTKNPKNVPRHWPGRLVCRSIDHMSLGTFANFGIAAGALAVGGPYWGVIAFLAIALVRVAMDAQALRRDNETLQEQIVDLEDRSHLDLELDAPPESGARRSRPLVEKQAS